MGCCCSGGSNTKKQSKQASYKKISEDGYPQTQNTTTNVSHTEKIEIPSQPKYFYTKNDEYAVMYDRLTDDMYLAQKLSDQYGNLTEFQSMANAFISFMLENKNIAHLCYNLVNNEFFFHQSLPAKIYNYNTIYFNLNNDNPQASIYVTFLQKNILNNHTIKAPFWLECDIYLKQRIERYNNNNYATNLINTNEKLENLQKNRMENTKFSQNDIIEMFEIFWKARSEKINAIKLVMCPPCAFNYKPKTEDTIDGW